MSVDPSQKIRIACPQCGKQLMVPSAALGKSGRCPACQHTFPLQVSSPTPVSAAPPVVRKPPVANSPAAPVANANPEPFGDLSTFDQGNQAMGQAPLGTPQSPLGGPQQPQTQLGAPQQCGQQQYGQPMGTVTPSAGFQQPNPGQWAAPANPYGTPATGPAKHRGKKEEGTPMGMIGGGVLMMLGAIVWFVVGLMGGVIFFYPPILLIIGLVSLIGGIAKLGKG